MKAGTTSTTTVARCAAILSLAAGIAGIRLLIWPDEIWNGRHELLAKLHASETIDEIPVSELPDRRRKGALIVDLRLATDHPVNTAAWRGRDVVFVTTPDRRRAALIQIRAWRRALDLQHVALTIRETTR